MNLYVRIMSEKMSTTLCVNDQFVCSVEKLSKGLMLNVTLLNNPLFCPVVIPLLCLSVHFSQVYLFYGGLNIIHIYIFS